MPGDNTIRQVARLGAGKRKPLSCAPCRQRKLRCDRRVPCGTCVRYQRETDCRLNPAKPLARGPAVVPVQTHAQRPTPQSDSGTGSADFQLGEAVGCAPVPCLQPSLQPDLTATPAVDAFLTLHRLLGLAVGPPLDGTPSLSLPEILAEANSQGGASISWSMLGVCHHPAQANQKLRLFSMLPSRSQSDLLLNHYMDHINWLFQTIHVPSFRHQYANFWDRGVDQIDLIWISLLFAVLSVSALYVPLEAVEVVGCPREFIRPLAHVWHSASRHALISGGYEARPCLVQLQTFSVTQLYWYATNDIETLNSRLGQAVRAAQALNLDKNISESTSLQTEMQHRLWWDLVDSDMFQTVCLDRPSLIRLRFPGVPFPRNCNDLDISETSIHSRPSDEPTEMSQNIQRAKLFQILNRYFNSGDDDEQIWSYDNICRLDAEILDLVAGLPWFFQLDENGCPPRIPEPLRERLAWQNHILRTCVSTQRIRLYRPFLSEGIGDAWTNCIKAAEDALTVYRSLRTEKAQTSRQKFFPQAYQIFSVAVTVSALFLVEGSLPIPDAYQQIRNMAVDLLQLDYQGCAVPIATRGKQVLDRMLPLLQRQNNHPANPEETQRFVPDIAMVLGGERKARAYMGRVAVQGRANDHRPDFFLAQLRPQVSENATPNMLENSSLSNLMGEELSPQLDPDRLWGGLVEGIDADLFLDNLKLLDLSNWDVSGLLLDSLNR